MARFADFILFYFSKTLILIYIIILIFYGFAYFYIFRFVLWHCYQLPELKANFSYCSLVMEPPGTLPLPLNKPYPWLQAISRGSVCFTSSIVITVLKPNLWSNAYWDGFFTTERCYTEVYKEKSRKGLWISMGECRILEETLGALWADVNKVRCRAGSVTPVPRTSGMGVGYSLGGGKGHKEDLYSTAHVPKGPRTFCWPRRRIKADRTCHTQQERNSVI